MSALRASRSLIQTIGRAARKVARKIAAGDESDLADNIIDADEVRELKKILDQNLGS